MTFAVVLVLGIEFRAAGLVAGRLHHVLALGAALPRMAALAAAHAAPALLVGLRARLPAHVFRRHRLLRVCDRWTRSGCAVLWHAYPPLAGSRLQLSRSGVEAGATPNSALGLRVMGVVQVAFTAASADPRVTRAGRLVGLRAAVFSGIGEVGPLVGAARAAVMPIGVLSLFRCRHDHRSC